MSNIKQVGGIKVVVCEDPKQVALESSKIFSGVVRQKPDIVLGLATGSTPLGLYKELIREHRENSLDFSRVKSFNLDEYLGLPKNHPQSYRYFMDSNLFGHINIDNSNTAVPDGNPDDITISCKKYEDDIKGSGGIDLQLLGIGANGHIAFNEPGSERGSRTRVVDLAEKTIKDNSRFFDDMAQVPKKAVTMGISTIIEAKKIVLLATGQNKKEAVERSLKGGMTSDIPASFLQEHPDCIFIVDNSAGEGL